jgi:hypothetical protein
MEMEGAIYLCGPSYNSIIDDLYDDYYKNPIVIPPNWLKFQDYQYPFFTFPSMPCSFDVSTSARAAVATCDLITEFGEGEEYDDYEDCLVELIEAD